MFVSCLNCGFAFESEDHNKPCPECGSRNRGISLAAEIKPHSFLKLGKKGTSKKHGHKFDAEIITGKRVGKDGKLVNIEQIIDRDSDKYDKIVKDEQGQTIVEKDERLSQHH